MAHRGRGGDGGVGQRQAAWLESKRHLHAEQQQRAQHARRAKDAAELTFKPTFFSSKKKRSRAKTAVTSMGMVSSSSSSNGSGSQARFTRAKTGLQIRRPLPLAATPKPTPPQVSATDVLLKMMQTTVHKRKYHTMVNSFKSAFDRVTKDAAGRAQLHEFAAVLFTQSRRLGVDLSDKEVAAVVTSLKDRDSRINLDGFLHTLRRVRYMNFAELDQALPRRRGGKVEHAPTRRRLRGPTRSERPEHAVTRISVRRGTEHAATIRQLTPDGDATPEPRPRERTPVPRPAGATSSRMSELAVASATATAESTRSRSRARLSRNPSPSPSSKMSRKTKASPSKATLPQKLTTKLPIQPTPRPQRTGMSPAMDLREINGGVSFDRYLSAANGGIENGGAGQDAVSDVPAMYESTRSSPTSDASVREIPRGFDDDTDDDDNDGHAAAAQEAAALKAAATSGTAKDSAASPTSSSFQPTMSSTAVSTPVPMPMPMLQTMADRMASQLAEKLVSEARKESEAWHEERRHLVELVLALQERVGQLDGTATTDPKGTPPAEEKEDNKTGGGERKRDGHGIGDDGAAAVDENRKVGETLRVYEERIRSLEEGLRVRDARDATTSKKIGAAEAEAVEAKAALTAARRETAEAMAALQVAQAEAAKARLTLASAEAKQLSVASAEARQHVELLEHELQHSLSSSSIRTTRTTSSTTNGPEDVSEEKKNTPKKRARRVTTRCPAFSSSASTGRNVINKNDSRRSVWTEERAMEKEQARLLEKKKSSRARLGGSGAETSASKNQKMKENDKEDEAPASPPRAQRASLILTRPSRSRDDRSDTNADAMQIEDVGRDVDRGASSLHASTASPIVRRTRVEAGSRTLARAKSRRTRAQMRAEDLEKEEEFESWDPKREKERALEQGWGKCRPQRPGARARGAVTMEAACSTPPRNKSRDRSRDKIGRRRGRVRDKQLDRGDVLVAAKQEITALVKMLKLREAREDQITADLVDFHKVLHAAEQDREAEFQRCMDEQAKAMKKLYAVIEKFEGELLAMRAKNSPTKESSQPDEVGVDAKGEATAAMTNGSHGDGDGDGVGTTGAVRTRRERSRPPRPQALEIENGNGADMATPQIMKSARVDEGNAAQDGTEDEDGRRRVAATSGAAAALELDWATSSEKIFDEEQKARAAPVEAANHPEPPQPESTSFAKTASIDNDNKFSAAGASAPPPAPPTPTPTPTPIPDAPRNGGCNQEKEGHNETSSSSNGSWFYRGGTSRLFQ